MRAAIRQAGAKLFFLPKYSPDMNPIEQLFAKLKHHRRKAQTRSKDAVCDAIANTPRYRHSDGMLELFHPRRI